MIIMSNTFKRGKKVLLIPTKEQEQLFWQFAGTRRFIYNWALDLQMKSYKENSKLIPFKELHHLIVNLKNNDNSFKWLKSVSCDVTKQAIKDLETAYSNYFKKMKQSNYKPYSAKQIAHSKRIGKPLTIYDRNGHPRFKKKLKGEESFHQDCMHIQFKGNKIFIAKIGWVKIGKHNPFPQGKSGIDFKIYNAKVKLSGNKWYFVAAIDVDIVNKEQSKSEPIGIDLGIKDLAILSNGEKYKNINKTNRIKKLEKRKIRLQRKLSRKFEANKEGTKFIKTQNIIKLQKQIYKIETHLKNIRKDYNHKFTSSVVKRNPIFIAIEDLNVNGMMKNKHLSKHIQNQSFNTIRTYFTYKCEEQNIPLYIVDRFYPSSKTCSCCGSIKHNLKLSDRIYKCNQCGNVIDRDINAAINLRNYGQIEYNKSINIAL